ncbi:MAG: TilS substrate-binding domain-containing protein, partial [Microlunatus sp.]|nr:TilS substrate-binding domain-containing protein [Microlunatus sp.]
VLLGHTRHDQAETVLLALARGSGTRSLAGMAVRNGRWLRPLLDLGRETTELACRENDLVPWLDPHNFDAAYARVRVRTSGLPTLERELGPGIAAALARTARLARDDADALDALAADADPGTATLDCRSMTALVPALRRRVLTRWLRLEHGLDGLTSAHLFAVEELLTAWHGQAGVDVPGGVRVRRVEGRLEATPVDNAVSPLVRGNVRPGQR